MKSRVLELSESEVGASFVEYAVALTLIVIVSIGAITFLGQATEARTSESLDAVKNIAPCSPGSDKIPCF